MRRWPLLLGAAVLGSGLLRGAYFHFVAEPIWRFEETRPKPVDARYAALRAALPGHGRIGYRTHAPQGSEEFARRYTQALYSLAPLVLVPDDGTVGLVVVDEDTSPLAQVERR
jgi:hypothetical protein